jgi:site-specific recombinase XerD
MRGIYEKVNRSGKWWIRYADVDGKIRRELAGSKANAHKLLLKRKAAVLEGRKLPENLRQKPVSFAEIADEALAYSRLHKRSYRDDEYRMIVLKDWFGYRSADSIKTQDIEAEFAKQKWSGATCNRYRSLLSMIYRVAIQNDRLKENPIRKLKKRRESPGRVRFLEKVEEQALRVEIRKVCPAHEDEFDLALNTGMRRNEQYCLRWDAVNLRLGIINVVDSKNGQRRSIPANRSAVKALRSLLKRKDGSGYVVPGTEKNRTRAWDRWFEDAVKMAEVTDFHWHDLRHTFASRLIMGGVDLRSVGELLGHKTLVMVMRYSHLAPGHLRDAVNRLVRKRTDPRTDTKAVMVPRRARGKSRQPTVN